MLVGRVWSNAHQSCLPKVVGPNQSRERLDCSAMTYRPGRGACQYQVTRGGDVFWVSVPNSPNCWGVREKGARSSWWPLVQVQVWQECSGLAAGVGTDSNTEVRSSVCSVRCAVCSVQRLVLAVYSVLCAVCSV